MDPRTHVYILPGDVKVYQHPLVAGQKQEVLKVLKDVLLSRIDPESGNIAITITDILDALTGDALPHLMGVILLKEGEIPLDLVRVHSFVERGREFLFQMENGIEREVLQHFFALNKEEAEKYLAMLPGAQTVTSLSGMSKSPSEA